MSRGAEGAPRGEGAGRGERASAAPGVDAAARSAEPQRPPPLPRRKPLVREYAEAVLLALAVAFAARATAAETYRIPSASMAPALLAGDHVLVSKLSYGLRVPFTRTWIARWREVRRGDVIVFEHPDRAGETHVKRVIGVPGDVIEVRGQVLHVNGVPQPRARVGAMVIEQQGATSGAWWSETCALWREQLARDASAQEDFKVHDVLQCRDPVAGEREGPFDVVEPGHLFVAGDNRDRSEDGRAGKGWQLPMSHVVGKAVRVLWSRGPDGAPGAAGPRFRTERLFKPVG